MGTLLWVVLKPPRYVHVSQGSLGWRAGGPIPCVLTALTSSLLVLRQGRSLPSGLSELVSCNLSPGTGQLS